MQTVIASIGKNPYKTILSNNRHELIADENMEHNGQDLGPNPGEIMAMSLASCTAITLRMYANRKGWDIDQIEVTVKMKQETEKTTFTRVIEVKGRIGEDEKKRLLNIANACPIHKTLTHPIETNTQIL
jgi:putative redox protein